MASEILQPVKSSMFDAIGYIDDTWALVVRYKSSGLTLAYQSVPPELYDALINAESIGKFFNENIKGKFEAIGDEYDTSALAKQVEAKPAKTAPVDNCMLDEEDLKLLDPPEVQTIDATAEDDPLEAEYNATLAQIPQAEVLEPWQPPKMASEAITLLDKRSREIDAIIRQNTERSQLATTMRVSDQATYDSVAKEAQDLAVLKDSTITLLDPFRVLLYDSYKFALDRKNSATTCLDAGIAHLKSQMLAFQREQERIRREAQEKANREAEEEAKRQQAALSQQITMAEMEDKIEAGDTQGAERLLFEPIEVPKPYVAPEIIQPGFTKATGTSTTKKFKIDEDAIEDEVEYKKSIVALLVAVKEGRYDMGIAAEHLQWNISKLNKLVAGVGQAFNVPGLRIRDVDSMRLAKPKRGR